MGTSDADLFKLDRELLSFGKQHELIDPKLLEQVQTLRSILSTESTERTLLMQLTEQQMRSSFPVSGAPSKADTSASSEAHLWWLPQEYTVEEIGIDEYNEDEDEECSS
jgi:hypothetical protein